MGKLDMNKYRNMAPSGGSRDDGWKPTPGVQHKVRVLRYQHDGNTEFCRCVVRHFGVNEDRRPVFSNETLMDIVRGLKDKDQERYDIIKPTIKYYMNIVDMTTEETRAKGVQIWAAPKGFFEQVMKIIENADFGEDYLFGAKGCDLYVKYEGPRHRDPKTMYAYERGEKAKSKVLGSKEVAGIKDLDDDEWYQKLAVEWQGSSIKDIAFVTGKAPKKEEGTDDHGPARVPQKPASKPSSKAAPKAPAKGGKKKADPVDDGLDG